MIYYFIISSFKSQSLQISVYYQNILKELLNQYPITSKSCTDSLEAIQNLFNQLMQKDMQYSTQVMETVRFNQSCNKALEVTYNGSDDENFRQIVDIFQIQSVQVLNLQFDQQDTQYQVDTSFINNVIYNELLVMIKSLAKELPVEEKKTQQKELEVKGQNDKKPSNQNIEELLSQKQKELDETKKKMIILNKNFEANNNKFKVMEDQIRMKDMEIKTLRGGNSGGTSTIVNKPAAVNQVDYLHLISQKDEEIKLLKEQLQRMADQVRAQQSQASQQVVKEQSNCQNSNRASKSGLETEQIHSNEGETLTKIALLQLHEQVQQKNLELTGAKTLVEKCSFELQCALEKVKILTDSENSLKSQLKDLESQKTELEQKLKEKEQLMQLQIKQEQNDINQQAKQQAQERNTCEKKDNADKNILEQNNSLNLDELFGENQPNNELEQVDAELRIKIEIKEAKLRQIEDQIASIERIGFQNQKQMIIDKDFIQKIELISLDPSIEAKDLMMDDYQQKIEKLNNLVDQYYNRVDEVLNANKNYTEYIKELEQQRVDIDNAYWDE